MILKSILARVFQGYRTGTFPTATGPNLPPDFKGRPRLDASLTAEELAAAAKECPCAGCLAMRDGVASLDMGRCVFCGRCAEVTGKIVFTKEYRLGVFRRGDLVVKAGEGDYVPPRNPDAAAVKLLKRSFHIREVSAGGCAACELDFNVLGTLAWDFGRFGIRVVASPRHADAVYLTGPVSRNMSLALEKTYLAMPEPRYLVAAGTCAISGGLFAGSPELADRDRDAILQDPPVSLFIPGCPPHPATTLEALLRMIGRQPGPAGA